MKDSGNKTLVYRKDRGNYRYYSQTCVERDRKRTYLSDQDEIIRLFSKKLQLSWLKDYEKKLDAVNAYLRKDDGMEHTEALLENEAWRKVLLQGYDKWQNADYERNTAFPEGLIYQGANGRKVRSKSEGDIDWGLNGEKLPNRYEPKLILSGRIVFPDFQIVNPLTKDVVLWEHFGRMDDPEYEERTYDKIRLYKANGYFPDDNLIMTFEDKTHPLTNHKIRKVIEEHFGDWLRINGGN